MMRSTATVQPSALHPPVPQSSPHLHRTAPGSSAGVLDTCVFLVAKKEKKGRHMGNDRFFFNSRRSRVVYVTSILYLFLERHQQIGYKFIRF